MRNRERLKNEIDDLKHELDNIGSGSRLKLWGHVIDKCLKSEKPEKTLKELEEELGEDDPLIDLAKVLLSTYEGDV